MAPQSIYQFYAEIEGFQPAIWRRFEVSENITMAQLGYVLMTLFEMKASHLFCLKVPLKSVQSNVIPVDFNTGDPKNPRRTLPRYSRYEIPTDPYDIPFEAVQAEQIDACTSLLKDCISGKAPILFHYDYGDNWTIRVSLEQVCDEALPEDGLPRVTDGAGHGIIEDCGGIPGLYNIVEAFQEKSGAQYESYRTWMQADHFDISQFDLEEMNDRVKKIPPLFRKVYEDHETLPEQSIRLIERRDPDGPV